MSTTRLPAALLLAALAVAAAVLAVTASIWFFVAVPFLAAAAYGAWLGLSPARFAAALDDETGAGPLPF